MEFFRIRRDIPFMRFALTFNVISLVTFVLAVIFLAVRGLNLGRRFPRRHGHRGRLRPRGRFQPRARRDRHARARRLFGAELRPLRHGARAPAAQGRRVERAAVGARDGRAARGRPVGAAAARRVRRPAGRQGALRERRARAAAGLARHRRVPRDALRVALRRRGHHRQPARHHHHPRASSRSSSGSSRCRCWPPCSPCWATR